MNPSHLVTSVSSTQLAYTSLVGTDTSAPHSQSIPIRTNAQLIKFMFCCLTFLFIVFFFLFCHILLNWKIVEDKRMVLWGSRWYELRAWTNKLIRMCWVVYLIFILCFSLSCLRLNEDFYRILRLVQWQNTFKRLVWSYSLVFLQRSHRHTLYTLSSFICWSISNLCT